MNSNNKREINQKLSKLHLFYLSDLEFEIVADALEKECMDYQKQITPDKVDQFVDSTNDIDKASSIVSRFQKTGLLYRLFRSRIGKITEFKKINGIPLT